jgi:general secretion pathway protein J
LKGFTLLELLVALSIFAILAAMAYGGLNTVLNASLQTQQQAARLASLQMTMHILGRDIRQAVAKPIRDEFNQLQPAMLADSEQLSLIHLGWHNPTQQARSELRQVEYFVRDNKLYYRYELNLKPVRRTYQTVLLEGVERVQWRFLDKEQQWQTSWQHLTQLPLAIEMHLHTQVWGEIRRVFSLEQSLATNNQQKSANSN